MSKYQPYPSYKDSGVRWFDDIPSNWQVLRNKMLFEQSKALVGKKSKNFTLLSLSKKGVIIRDLENAQGKFPAEFDSYQIVIPNDLIFCLFDIDETPRTVGLSKHLGMITGAYNIFKSKPNVDPQYIHYYYLHIDSFKGLKPFYSGLRKTIRPDTFLNIEMPCPTFSEQTAIANFLDQETTKIDTLIEKQQRLIELLKEKRQAVISHAVTKGLSEKNSHWKHYRIDWISRIVRGNTGFKKDELLNSGKYVALQYGKTYKVDEVDEMFNYYVNEEFYKSNQIVDFGSTILISTSETMEDLGHSCFYNRRDVGLIGGEQILLKPKKQHLYDKYLFYASRVFSNEVRRYATGLKVFRFNIDDLKKIFINLPPIQEQQDIVSYLDNKSTKIDTLIEKANKAITLLKERRTALISAAVTGKIDVRGLS